MSEASALACVERMKTDQEFRDQLAGAADDRARGEVLTAAGFDIDASDRDTIRNGLAASDGEVADDQLDNVAGGSGCPGAWPDTPIGPPPGWHPGGP